MGLKIGLKKIHSLVRREGINIIIFFQIANVYKRLLDPTLGFEKISKYMVRIRNRLNGSELAEKWKTRKFE